MTTNPAILDIALSMPDRPTSGDLLTALIRAEQAGYLRALNETKKYSEKGDLPVAT